MKKNLYSLFNRSFSSLLGLILLFSVQAFGQWSVYDAHVMPDEHDPVFGTSGLAGAGMVNELIADPDNPENLLLQLLTIENSDNGTWRHVYPEEVTQVTIVIRVKSANDNGRRVIEIDLDNGGFRERLYINQEDNLIRLQHSEGFGVSNEFPLPDEGSVKDWNIYRLTKDAEGNVTLYVNENPEPLAEGKTGQATSNNHFRFGDTNGSHNVSALLDWVIWDTSGVYAPGEGEPIPEGLLPAEPVEQAWFVYDASFMPEENSPAFGTSGLAGAGVITELVDDPENAENQLLQLLTVENADNGTWRHVYPEAVADVTIVMRVKSANDNGRRVLELDMDNGGFRERLYINQEDNLVRLQHSEGFGAAGEFPLPGERSVKAWNIYRLTKDADGNVKLYVNEKPEPLAEGKTGQSTGNNHFRFGDTNGSHNISALLDWIIWDPSGVYAPGEGMPIPDTLNTSIDEDEDPVEPEVHNWRIYDGRNLPADQIPEFDESNVAGAGASNILVEDTDMPGNSFLQLITATNSDNFMWRTTLQPETPGVTFVMKVKAANDEARRVLELDIHHNGIRERMYINREFNRVRLNEGIGGGDGGEIEAPVGTNLSEWNIYRLTKSGNETALYLNENPEPIATGTTGTSTSQQYFRIGDGNGSHNAAALIDWIIWDETGAYTPGEGSPIPQNVTTPNWDATLSTLMADGVLVEGFDPEQLQYEIVLAADETEIPQITAETNFSGASQEIQQAENVPGEATVAVTAFNGFTVNVYTLTVRHISSDASLSDLAIDGETIQNFDPETLEYTIILAQGTTEAPTVTAATNHHAAEVFISQAPQVPGETTVEVTAEDGTMLTYTIYFEPDPTSANHLPVSRIIAYPNPASDYMMIVRPEADQSAQIRIIGMNGKLFLEKTMTGQHLSLDVQQLTQGTYILQLLQPNDKQEFLFIKK